MIVLDPTIRSRRASPARGLPGFIEPDDLRPITGVLVGGAIGLGLWALIYFIVTAVWR